MKAESGQLIIIIAILLMVLLLLLAVIIDAARLFLEQQEINRALDAAGKAGLIVVGDLMVTQVVAAQTAAAVNTPWATTLELTPHPSPTATPEPDDFYDWLTVEDRQTLFAPPLQTEVAGEALRYLEKNGLGLGNPDVIDIRVSYPVEDHSGEPTLAILLELDRRMVVIFGRILGINQGILSGQSKQTIPH